MNRGFAGCVLQGWEHERRISAGWEFAPAMDPPSRRNPRCEFIKAAVLDAGNELRVHMWVVSLLPSYIRIIEAIMGYIGMMGRKDNGIYYIIVGFLWVVVKIMVPFGSRL